MKYKNKIDALNHIDKNDIKFAGIIEEFINDIYNSGFDAYSEDIENMKNKIVYLYGGEGSGNFGHGGRPGEIGGSGEGGGGKDGDGSNESEPSSISENDHLQLAKTAAAKMTDKELKTIEYYTREGYIKINQTLRGKIDDVESKVIAEDKIKVLDKAFEKAPVLDKEITVYRSFYNEERIVNLQGGTIKDNGFCSTSTDKEESMAFGRVTCAITVPKGTPVLCMGDGLGSKASHGEREILLPRGLQFHVSKVSAIPTRFETKYDVKMEVLR
jgi:hypothetical protein